MQVKGLESLREILNESHPDKNPVLQQCCIMSIAFSSEVAIPRNKNLLPVDDFIPDTVNDICFMFYLFLSGDGHPVPPPKYTSLCKRWMLLTKILYNKKAEMSIDFTITNIAYLIYEYLVYEYTCIIYNAE